MKEKYPAIVSLVLLLLLSVACSTPNPAPNPPTTPVATPQAAVTTAPPTPSVTAGTGRPVPTPRPTRPNTATIALLLAAQADDTSRQVKDVFVQAATSVTTTVLVSDAGGDAAKQKAQAADALKQGAQVLVIQPVDQDAAAAYVDAAHKAGAQVIALDRLINTRDLDAYVSFDNFAAGQAQAKEAVRVLTANKAKTPWNFVLLEGRAGDSVAAEITRGYYDVLKGLIDKKQVVVTVDQAHSAWSSDQAYKTTQDALTKTSNNIAAVLANSSALARGARLALDQQKLLGKVFVAGSGAEMENIQALCLSQQNLLFVQDDQALASTAAQLAAALARGQSVADTHLAAGTLAVADRQVPLARIPVRPVTLDTAQAELIQSGLYTPAQLGKCAPPLADGASTPHVYVNGSLTVWTQDKNLYPYLSNLAAQFGAGNPGVQIQVVQYETDTLQAKLQAPITDTTPDLLWATFDQSQSLIQADRVQAIDDVIDVSQFLTATAGALTVNARHYGAPVSVSNDLLLYYNKKLVKDLPQDTAALLRLAPILTKADGSQWAMTYNQTDPLYLIPWFTGMKGKLFADDGRTPLLNTPAMTDTLTLLKQFRDQKLIQPDTDGDGVDALFKQGKVGLVINDDESYPDYATALGDNLGVARLPRVAKTGEYPHPFASGRYLLLNKNVSGDKLAIARGFIQFVTSRAIQVEMAKKFKRLPALMDALTDGAIIGDPFLKSSADQALASIPPPPGPGLSCILDAIKSNMGPALTGKAALPDTAKAMQDAAEACINK
ncbi:MAG: extracellular solute-binding protein [Anaerolineae bacterium]